MRTCAKMRCTAEAVATVGLSYEGRVVVVGNLVPEPNPNLVDLCSAHLERLTPPIGWRVRDERAAVPATLS
ncbi:MAG TPA: DUF3499 family protein [Actinomycetota bacterium]|nr:DUF3499 family protein [Actinomycetota bacterium]